MDTFSRAVLGEVRSSVGGVVAPLNTIDARLQGIERRIEEISQGMGELMKPRVEPLYMSVAQAAERYGIGKTMMYEIVNLPEAPPVLKVGARVTLPILAYDRFMAEQFADEGRTAMTSA